jgi:predicted kinase
MNDQTFTMLVGLPGSGKSVYAENMKDVVVCSSDEKRLELFGDINDQEHNDQVFRELHNDIKKYLNDGHDVVFDACNINSKRRRSFLENIKKIKCRKEAVVFAIPYERCLRRNWMRERRIPDEVIYRMYTQWQTPAKFEGFDDILVIKDEHNIKITDYHISNIYDQHNPHHNYFLNEHMYQTFQNLKKYDVKDINLLNAGLYHDIGKPFCREFDEDGVAHYYNHANVGAYDVLCMNGDTLLTSQLINYHMYPMTWDNQNWDKMCEKYRKIWGQEFFGKIMLLYEADKAAN